MSTSEGARFACESALSPAKGHRNSFLNIQQMPLSAHSVPHCLQPGEGDPMLFKSHKGWSDQDRGQGSGDKHRTLGSLSQGECRIQMGKRIREASLRRSVWREMLG